MNNIAVPLDAALNANPEFTVRHVGQEKEPVLVIDQALRNPESLVDFAADLGEFQPAAAFRSGYPGLLAPAPSTYVQTLVGALTPMIAEVFALGAVKAAQATSNYSLVTVPPEELSVGQRVPHIDDADPLQFAILHYLCDDDFGGTAFFRHRATGFETLSRDRVSIHRAVLDSELSRDPPPAAYVSGDTAQYEQTAVVEARFNRMLVYRSRVFHSGVIRPGDRLSADPRRGRLTANVFLVLRPA